MDAVAARYPTDTEASIFYALSLNTTLNPNDKTYATQLKAAGILGQIFAKQPDHPGVAPYPIHSSDFPPIAANGLGAARQLARDKDAADLLLEIRRIDKIDTENFAAAFAFAAIPARDAIERRQWSDAAQLPVHPQSLWWSKFPQVATDW